MSRARLAVALTVMASFLTGAALGRLGATGADSESPRPAPAATPHASPPAATGFGPTPDGARAAALEYAAAATRWLYLTDAQLRAAVLAIATADAGPALAERTVAEIRVAREALRRTSGRVWWLVRPLAWRLDSYGDTDARLSVWTVSVLSATGVAVPQSDWRTLSLTLRWEIGTWRVAAVSDRPGPTPTVGGRDVPWQAEPFDTGLRGFHRIGAESDR